MYVVSETLLSTTTFDEKSEVVDTCTWYEFAVKDMEVVLLLHFSESSVRETLTAPESGDNNVGAGSTARL